MKKHSTREQRTKCEAQKEHTVIERAMASNYSDKRRARGMKIEEGGGRWIDKCPKKSLFQYHQGSVPPPALTSSAVLRRPSQSADHDFFQLLWMFPRCNVCVSLSGSSPEVFISRCPETPPAEALTAATVRLKHQSPTVEALVNKFFLLQNYTISKRVGRRYFAVRNNVMGISLSFESIFTPLMH